MRRLLTVLGLFACISPYSHLALSFSLAFHPLSSVLLPAHLPCRLSGSVVGLSALIHRGRINDDEWISGAGRAQRVSGRGEINVGGLLQRQQTTCQSDRLEQLSVHPERDPVVETVRHFTTPFGYLLLA
jgi:hypothetical protein